MSDTSIPEDVLARLFAVIESRKGGDPDESYTAKLLAAGRPQIARKVGEEAVELVTAALTDDRVGTIAESADLIYHMLVLWAEAGLTPDEIWAELARREGVSGIAEKASRNEK